MDHFPTGFEGIVEYTYGQKFKGNNSDQYSIVVLKDGVPINTISWYYEHQLTLINNDIEAGMELIKEWTDKEI